MRYLPSLNALRAFHAAAKFQNFSVAAEELHVTHGAVSRHIRQLEEALDTRLFHRLPRGVELTADGRSLAFAVAQAFDTLSDAVAVFRNEVNVKRVTVSTVPSIAARWFAPKLEQFQKDLSSIELCLSTTIQIVDPRKADVDFVIRYGRGKWPGLYSELLFPRTLLAVCAPEFLKRFRDTNLQSYISDINMIVSNGFKDWDMWLKAVGLEGVKPRSVLQLDDSNVAIQAAVDGQGLALLPEVLVKHEIKTGRLLSPMLESIQGDLGYYLAWPQETELPLHVQQVINWIRKKATEAQGSE